MWCGAPEGVGMKFGSGSGSGRGLKIAIFTDLYLEVPGGIPSSIRAQKKALTEMGHEVTVFCPGSSCKEPGVVIVPTMKHLRVNGAPLARSPEKVMEFVRKEYPVFSQFDVVHVHYEASCSIAGVLLAREFKVPLVQTMHGREDMAIAVNVPHPFKTVVAGALSFLHGRYIKHKRVVLRSSGLAPTLARAEMWTLMVNQANAADRVITPSEHFAEKLRNYGVSRPITAVSNGVDDALAEGEWPVREREAGEPLRMIWNSRVSREKRMMSMLKALKLISEQPFLLDVYGSGNELKKARRFVRRHGMERKVKFHGAVPHDSLLQKMRKMHLSVTVTYGFDTQGLTLLEAAATGLPVFYCDPDMGESVPRGGGVCADGPEPEEMAEMLQNIIETPECIREMSQAMLKRRGQVLQSGQIEKLVRVYGEVIKGQKRR